MSDFILNFLFTISVAMASVTAGWMLRNRSAQRSSTSSNELPSNGRQKVDSQKEEANRQREIMGRLQDMAISMAADVDAHSTRVQEISDGLATDGQGADDVLDAVTKIIESNQRMQHQLVSAEEKLSQQAQQIESHAAEARTDALTLLANRRAFDDEMQRCSDQFTQQGKPVTLMMVDVDYFKNFNDKHGHLAGDAVLKRVASTLRNSIDTAGLVTRYGGEEFAIIFPNQKISDASNIAHRARCAISDALVEFEGVQLRVTASAGLSELLSGENIESFIRRADEALYASKQAGRDCGHWHDGEKFQLLILREQEDPDEAREQQNEANDTTPSEQSPSVAAVRLDPLTGLSNRTAFLEDMNRRVAEWKRGGSSLTVMAIQIDHFQRFADLQGSEVSETILRTATRFLSATMRDMDHVARIDSDTFALLLPGAVLTDAVAIAERLRQAISRCELTLEGQKQHFTVSLGVAEIQHGDDCEMLLEKTQIALESAVQNGCNCCYQHNGEDYEPVDAESATT